MTGEEALAFVRRHGVVLQSARGPVPSLAETIAGEPIRGSWWAHEKSHEIFQASRTVCDSAEILVCRLVDGKVTYVDRRLWPALVKLAARFKKDGLAKLREEHTRTGAHRTMRQPFPVWVPDEVTREANKLSVAEAEALLAPLLSPAGKNKR